MIKRLLKKILPANFINWYHLVLARSANIFYGRPSHWLKVIGVTGTNGKSTTVELVSQLLRSSGARVGHLATTTIRIGDEEWLNDTKMTMIGRFGLQRYLKKMLRAGCQYVIIEVTSQGLEQHRGEGIEFDAAVLTNLTPEHIEAHGSFDNYAKAKERLFALVSRRRQKVINKQEVPTVSIINIDSNEAERFSKYQTSKRYGYTVRNTQSIVEGQNVIKAKDIKTDERGSNFKIQNVDFKLPLLGDYNIENSLAAVCLELANGFNLSQISEWLKEVKPSPGRLEWIDEGQPFKVMVDQAPEPTALAKVLAIASNYKHGRLIHVYGSAGGGRDKARRPIMGKMSVEQSDISIITNEDPYDEDPLAIINQIKSGALTAGGVENESVFIVPERGEAIKKALTMAQADDFVLITGKGSEQAIVTKNNKKIPWDDRKVIREMLTNL
ncbi:Mur ligase family protein [Patescibacteria group bacterium]